MSSHNDVLRKSYKGHIKVGLDLVLKSMLTNSRIIDNLESSLKLSLKEFKEKLWLEIFSIDNKYIRKYIIWLKRKTIIKRDVEGASKI